MSFRRKASHFLALVVVAALAVGLMAAPASAKMSSKQKAQIRKQLKAAVKKNPKVVMRKSFLKKASLVNFTLPITVKLRNSGSGVPQGAGNPNVATLDLGASLGTRTLNLGGSLGGEITFHDSFDGGALGNVDLTLNPSTTKSLTTTSIPLLWNSDVSNGGITSLATSWDTGLATANALTGGCSNWSGAANLPFDPNNLSGAAPAGGFPGVPEYNLAGATPTGAFVPVSPGVDGLDQIAASKTPGNINNLGGNQTPFPAAAGFTPPSVKDTVLRTAPLKLQIAPTGITVPTAGGPDGTQNVTIGKSGGQANLFGNIPGKTYGIDVTLSLATQINSILRAVDVDAQRVRVGAPWPAALFNCRQAITGSVPNYIPDVKLKGSLKISPAITPAGDLRIAKASLSSLDATNPAHVALAACLSPHAVLAAAQNNTDTTTYNVPADPPGLVPTGNLPANTASYGRLGAGGAANPDFSSAGACNQQDATHPTQLVKDAGFSGLGVATAANGYSPNAISSDGSKVSVSGDITVNDVEADIILGDR